MPPFLKIGFVRWILPLPRSMHKNAQKRIITHNRPTRPAENTTPAPGRRRRPPPPPKKKKTPPKNPPPPPTRTRRNPPPPPRAPARAPTLPKYKGARRQIPHRPRPDGLLPRPQRKPRQSRMAHPRGRCPRRANRLPPGAVPLSVFLPRRERRALRSGRVHPRSLHRRAWPAGRRTGPGRRRVSL